MTANALANTPLINYFRYKQTTNISAVTSPVCYVITAFSDGGNGQLVLTTTETDNVNVQESITIASTANYDGNYSVISKTATTINVSGTFVSTETGTWQLNTNGTGGTAGEPLDFGKIYFYDQDDKVTFQNTYSDRLLATVNPNPITLDAVGSYPVIYMITEPYYIEIYDKFNNLVETLNDYLPEDEDQTAQSENIENLFASYGFDTRIDVGQYSENPLPINMPQNAISGGWFWEINTGNVSEDNTYFFTALGDSALIGNPKNTCTFKSTANSSGDILKNWVAVIGDYNAFQNNVLNPIQLTFSIFDRIISGGTSSLVIQLRRTKNGVNETPISVGTIPISATRTQQTLTFNVPVLTDADYSNDDTLSLLIAAPLNSDFEIELTGTWLQISPDGTLDISESPVSQQGVQEWAGKGFNILKNPDFSVNSGLPLAIGPSAVLSLNQTGSIFLAHKDSVFNYALPMNAFPGTLLTRDVPIDSNNITNTNRLIDYFETNSIEKSRLTVTASRAAAVVSLTTGIGSTQLNTSSTNANPRVTINQPTDEFIYKIKAEIDINLPQRVHFTFIDQFAPGQNSFNPDYTTGTPDTFTMTGHPIYLPGNTPKSSPIISWFGVTRFTTAIQSNVQSNDKKPGQCYFSNDILNITVNDGTMTNAIVDITFADNATVFHNNNILYFYEAQYSNNSPSWSGVGGGERLYLNRLESVGQAGDANGNAFSTGTLNNGYLAWNDISSNPSTQVASPPHVLRYNIDGNNGINTPSGSINTLIVPINTNDTAKQIALKTSDAINTSWILDVDIVSTPNNGDTVSFSGETQDFEIIFYDTDLTKTAVTAGKIPIYVEFVSSDLPETVAQALVDAIQHDIYGIPFWPDLGLPALDSYLQPNAVVDLTYFIAT